MSVHSMLGELLDKLQRGGVEEQMKRKQAFVAELRQLDIAVQQSAANEQHYEVPAEVFEFVLGARLKYSCCWYTSTRTSLDDAELAMLELYIKRARVEDGMVRTCMASLCGHSRS